MSINLYTRERISYLLERVSANVVLLPRIDHAWSEAARSPNTVPEEQAMVEAEFREAWRDLMQRYNWLAEHYDDGQMTEEQQDQFERLVTLLHESRDLIERLGLQSPPR